MIERRMFCLLFIFMLAPHNFAQAQPQKNVCDEMSKQGFTDFDRILSIKNSVIFAQKNVRTRKSIVIAKLVSEAEIIKFVKGSEVQTLEVLSNGNLTSIASEEAVGYVSGQIQHQYYQKDGVLCSEF
jgi:hypothetical protein